VGVGVRMWDLAVALSLPSFPFLQLLSLPLSCQGPSPRPPPTPLLRPHTRARQRRCTQDTGVPQRCARGTGVPQRCTWGTGELQRCTGNLTRRGTGQAPSLWSDSGAVPCSATPSVPSQTASCAAGGCQLASGDPTATPAGGACATWAEGASPGLPRGCTRRRFTGLDMVGGGW